MILTSPHLCFCVLLPIADESSALYVPINNFLIKLPLQIGSLACRHTAHSSMTTRRDLKKYLRLRLEAFREVPYLLSKYKIVFKMFGQFSVKGKRTDKDDVPLTLGGSCCALTIHVVHLETRQVLGGAGLGGRKQRWVVHRKVTVVVLQDDQSCSLDAEEETSKRAFEFS